MSKLLIFDEIINSDLYLLFKLRILFQAVKENRVDMGQNSDYSD